MSRISQFARAARLLFYAPRYALDWDRAIRAAEAREWAEVERVVDRIHRNGMATGASRLWLAIAYLHGERHGDALRVLEEIDEPLETPEEEGSRNLNYAIALYNLGRRDDAVSHLRATISPEWRPTDLDKANELLRQGDYEHH